MIGLASAWRAARRGASVCVLERERPGAGATESRRGCSRRSGEATWGEEALLALDLESLAGGRPSRAELESESEMAIGFVALGALHVALDRDEAEELRRRYELHRGLGLGSEWLPGRACRKLEPGLAPSVRGGAHVPGEASVDPRRVMAALLGALERRGVESMPARRWCRLSGGRPLAGRYGGWPQLQRGPRSSWPRAAGRERPTGSRWSRPPVRPVKGEIVTLRGSADEPACERIVAGERVYMVPRADGRLIVGATVEERGFDTTVTAGGVHELLREAYRLIPEIAELELVETTAGLRPGTPDNAPLIGSSATDGLLIATGTSATGSCRLR